MTRKFFKKEKDDSRQINLKIARFFFPGNKKYSYTFGKAFFFLFPQPLACLHSPNYLKLSLSHKSWFADMQTLLFFFFFFLVFFFILIYKSSIFGLVQYFNLRSRIQRQNSKISLFNRKAKCKAPR